MGLKRLENNKRFVVFILIIICAVFYNCDVVFNPESNPSIIANFTAAPLSGTAPLNVQFTDTSTGNITTREWDFDNDSIVDSALQNPSYMYNNNGSYTVSLTVSGPNGSDTETKTDYITVNLIAAPVADFSALPLSGNAPLNVQFTDTSTGNITSWAWDFDNSGGPPDSTLQNPQCLYINPGIYTVSLTVTGPGGSDTMTKVNYIAVLSPISWLMLSASPLSGRYAHTAVWTGTEMIIWGGRGSSPTYKGDGARYNPATGLWTATSTSNAPSPRSRHSAIWTGTEMIIWGGWNGGPIDTGAKYNPSTNIWTTTTQSGAPTARRRHTAVWTGTEMIIWGGNAPLLKNDGARYNPATNTWTPTTLSGAPSARYSNSAVWTGTEMIIWAGWDGPRTNTGGRYNPSTNIWAATTLTNAPTARSVHSEVWTGTEMIIWGGIDAAYTRAGGRYNPGTDSWTATTLTNAPPGRRYLSAVWTGTEMIIWGGYDGGNLNTGGRYNPTTNSWIPTSTSGVPSRREQHTAIWTGSNMIIWGGRGSSPINKNDGAKYFP